MTTDPQTYFGILMASIEQAMSSIDVKFLKGIQAQIKEQLPNTPEQMPFSLDRHKNDFAILHKNAEFLDKVIELVIVADQLQKLKTPAIAFKRSFNKQASQQ